MEQNETPNKSVLNAFLGCLFRLFGAIGGSVVGYIAGIMVSLYLLQERDFSTVQRIGTLGAGVLIGVLVGALLGAIFWKIGTEVFFALFDSGGTYSRRRL